MKSKGFTLIELLAVIVILAIIALIATPIVLNIIKDSKESATLQSSEFYLGAVETAVAKKIIDDSTFKPTSCDIQEDGNLKCDEIDVKVETNGEVPSSGTITLENGKIKDVSLTLSGKTLIKDGDKLLEPGLYDEDGNLIASWDKLVNEYGINIQKNYGEGNNPSKPGEIIMSNNKLSKGVKLVIDSLNTTIGSCAFHNWTTVKKIIIPNTITSIGAHAFRKCDSLEKINIPNSVITIGSYAFYECKSLEKMTIPNSVTSIGNHTFRYCTNLREINIPDSVTKVENSLLEQCTNLRKITIGNNVVSIGSYAFSGCSSLENIIIPTSVTSIGNHAFHVCTNLKEITIPNSVVSIGDWAFANSSIKEITIPNSVISIGTKTFRYCTNLKIINYTGIREQWDKISFGADWDEKMPIDYAINYAAE